MGPSVHIFYHATTMKLNITRKMNIYCMDSNYTIKFMNFYQVLRIEVGVIKKEGLALES